MLGKLLKYDVKFGARAFLGMSGVLLLLGLLAPLLSESAVAFATPLVIIPIAVACVILIVQAYQKSLFSGQGYFTLTLPVKPGALIFSKALIAMFWFNVILVSTLCGIILLERDFSLFVRLFEAFWNYFFFWLEVNALALSVILAVYMGVALGNVSVKKRRLGWIGYGVGIAVPLVLQGLLSSQLLRPLIEARYVAVTDTQLLIASGEELGELHRMGANVAAFDWTSLASAIIMCVACYFATVWLIKKKVNLQ